MLTQVHKPQSVYEGYEIVESWQCGMRLHVGSFTAVCCFFAKGSLTTVDFNFERMKGYFSRGKQSMKTSASRFLNRKSI
jgi:hypothetical protein